MAFNSSRIHNMRSLFSLFSSDLAIDLGTANTLVYAAVVLATPFALSLTAVALGAPTRISEMRLRVFRLAGRKLYLGAALVLAPFFVITSLGDVFSKQLQRPPAMIADTCVGLTVFFLTGIAFAGYLARLYAKADVAG